MNFLILNWGSDDGWCYGGWGGLFIGLGEALDDPGRYTHNEGVGWDVFGDHATCAGYGSVADFSRGYYHGINADKGIAAYGSWMLLLVAPIIVSSYRARSYVGVLAYGGVAQVAEVARNGRRWRGWSF